MFAAQCEPRLIPQLNNDSEKTFLPEALETFSQVLPYEGNLCPRNHIDSVLTVLVSSIIILSLTESLNSMAAIGGEHLCPQGKNFISSEETDVI